MTLDRDRPVDVRGADITPGSDHEHAPEHDARVVVSDGPIVWEPRVVELDIPDELRPDWLSNHPLPMFVEEVRDGPEGETVCSFRRAGQTRPAVTRTDDGVVFHFDPLRTIDALTHERYWQPRRPLHSYLPVRYSRLAPSSLRRPLRRVTNRLSDPRDDSALPTWPIESSVEALRALLTTLLGASERWDAPRWPDGAGFAVVLTHDLDSKLGQRNTLDFVKIAEQHGFRATCFVVGDLYCLDFDILDDLAARGHEIGLHGARHDCRFAFMSEDAMRHRLDACAILIERYGVRGFRSPWLMRTDRMFSVLGERFAYDSSACDTSRGSPRRKGNGCCTVFPFVRHGIVELPITLPMDAALIYGGFTPSRIVDVWKRKVEWIRRVGGMAMLCTHPEPHFSARPDMLSAYEGFLAWLADMPGTWPAAAREVCDNFTQTDGSDDE